MRPTFYRGCWHVVSRHLFLGYRPCSSPRKGLYDPKTFITHAASLRQTSVHCAIFLTAASRRSLGRVSVPVWGVTLSGPLPVVALVGLYPTNQLMGRNLIPEHRSFSHNPLQTVSLCGFSTAFAALSRSPGQISYVLLTRAPLSTHSKTSFPFDLHVLGTPPAFILSQDQTLRIVFRGLSVFTSLLLRCANSYAVG